MQLELALRDESVLQEELEGSAGAPLEVIVTDNTSTVMTLRREVQSGRLLLRLHRMFLYAGPRVMKALAAWVTRPRCRKAGSVIDAFIHENRHLVRRKAKRAGRVRARGVHHDLDWLFDEVNRAHFEGGIDARITWGRQPAKRRRRSIRFGSYSKEDHLIRIHPDLDRDFVPEYFVRYVVFHEMLHAHLGIEESENGRRRIHTGEFNRLERRYPDFARVEAWQRNPTNLRKLLK
jgi:hypothetical protein